MTTKTHPKLNSGQIHILKLIVRDRDADRWAFISKTLYSAISTNLPHELVIFEELEVGGRAKLTEDGEKVVYALNWLNIAYS